MLFINMNNEVKITRRGRPPVSVLWPDVVFTAQDVFDTCTERISRVTIHSKLNDAVDRGELRVVGKIKSANGRPRISYKKREETPLAFSGSEQVNPLNC